MPRTIWRHPNSGELRHETSYCPGVKTEMRCRLAPGWRALHRKNLRIQYSNRLRFLCERATYAWLSSRVVQSPDVPAVAELTVRSVFGAPKRLRLADGRG